MGRSSVEADFQFVSYKVDYFKYQMGKFIELLELNEPLDPSFWKYSLKIRYPIFFEQKNIYISGLEISLDYNLPNDEKSQDNNIDKEEKNIISLSAAIGGVFKTSDGRLPKRQEDTLGKIQAPALLLPYLRGTITSFLANAGFGSWVFPLINIHKVAEEQLKDVEIEVK